VRGESVGNRASTHAIPVHSQFLIQQEFTEEPRPMSAMTRDHGDSGDYLGSGVAASRARVYSCAGLEVICSEAPISTIAPWRMTAMLSLR